MSGTPRISVEVFEPLQISPRELAAALEDGEKLALLDARTLEEYDAGNLPGSQLVGVEATADILDTWPEDAFLVFYSNDGCRSLQTASYFRSYGFLRARSLCGGLATWDTEVGHEALPRPAAELWM